MNGEQQKVISDLLGKATILQSGKFNSDETKNILSEKIPSGVYWIEVENEKSIETTRFMKI